ncbi:MAG: S8 family serine peptidase, partial [Nitrolancea sp.]
MNRAVRVVAILLLALTALGIPLGALAQDTEQNAPQRYIVTFASNVPSAGSLAALLANSDGFRVTHSYDNVFKGFSAELSPMQVQWLRAFSSVTSIQPDSVAHVTDQTTPTGIQRIGDLLNGTANIGGGSSVNISVATLDTGIDINNSDLNVGGGFNAINASTCTGSASNGSYQDDNGHGTHVAGTIAAKDNGSGVVGVAPGAKVYAVKVFDSSGNGYVSSIICGINWIVSNATTDNIKVVNFSGAWGGSNSANCGQSRYTFYNYGADTAHQAVCSLVNTAGIPFVVAAGNDGKDASNTLPAAYPETIAVGALADSDGKSGGLGPNTSWGPDDTRATFSNYGSVVTIYAPGVDILSDWPGGGLARESGTSMATPHVTGAVALYLFNHPGASPATVANALVSNGEAGSWGSPYGSQPLLNVGNAAFGPVAPPTPVHNVVVSSITPSSPVIDTVANNVTVHISNTGNQSESGLQVILTDQTTSATIGTQNVSSALSAGAGTDVSFSWTPSGSGSHTLKAEVKNGNTDNTLTQGVTVNAVSHNITVTSVN